jgi:hypothetical protein
LYRAEVVMVGRAATEGPRESSVRREPVGSAVRVRDQSVHAAPSDLGASAFDDFRVDFLDLDDTLEDILNVPDSGAGGEAATDELFGLLFR